MRVTYGSFQTPPERLVAIRTRLGLDRPVPEQCSPVLGRLVQGDLGRAIVGDRPVLDILLARFPATLALASLAIAVHVGMGLGFLAADKRGT